MYNTTIPEKFFEIAEKKADKIAYYYKINGQYTPITFKKLSEKVEIFALGLLNLGIHKGDRIGIVSENRIEWIIADLAIASIGAIDVPVFPTLSAKQLEYIFNDCSATAIIVSNNLQLNKVLEIKDNLPNLRHIIIFNDDYQTNDIIVKSFNYISNRGNEIRDEKERKKIINNSLNKLTPDDILTIIYTSGTTGNPKGVVLTHKNIYSNVIGVYDAIYFDENDLFLSFLPLCHSYERTTAYYSALLKGVPVALAESIETISTNMQEIKPTLMTTVPKMLELIKKRIYSNLEKESLAKRKIFYWAVDVGRKYFYEKINKKIKLNTKVQHRLAHKLVFSKILEKTGGRLRLFVSGGAPLAPEVCEFFNAVGITVLEGYGLTEASPVVSVNRIESIEIGTIGKPLFNTEVKIADDGEILVRGPNVMKEYWNDKLATEQAIDEEGWLYTGDIGTFTEKGNIKITDRKKHIFVNSGGKNIAPQPIENLLAQSIYIDQCILIGDRREYCTALIFPNFENLEQLAKNLNIKYNNPSELISNQTIIDYIKKDIDRLQKDLAKYEKVRKFSLLSQPFTIENGELTPKLSIKRHVVERKYADFIEQMYKM